MLVPKIGNTYSGSAIIGLTAILDEAKPGDRILLISYGSGAGSDAMVLETTDNLIGKSEKAPTTKDYIDRRTVIDYSTYARMRGRVSPGS